ncbi:MAG: GTPase Era, partial [Gammaproteobacteria bacterium]|nr:GTPase Era [Gammaproteobacteria bacterium]
MRAMRSGFVAVVGRPNVGKSTLINALMGTKVSIVTAKPQTTRHRILAVHTSDQAQIIFVDTPGLHRKAGKAMNRMMNRTAANALADADVVLFVTEAGRWTDEDNDVLRRLQTVAAPVVAVLNKVDLIKPKEKLLEIIAATADRHEFAEILPVSAEKHDNLDVLLSILPGHLPESPPLFPEDMQTDRSVEFQAAEVIREKLTQSL